MLDITTVSDILYLTKLHISEYSRFRLLLRNKDKRLCTATAYTPVIMSVEYNIGVKVRLRSVQGCMYLSLFSFSTVSIYFTYVCCR